MVLFEALLSSQKSSGHVKGIFQHHAKTSCQNLEKFSIKLGNEIKTKITHLTALSEKQPKIRNNLRSKSENNCKIRFFFNAFFDYGETQCIFWQLYQKNTTNSFSIFRSSTEINHKKFGFFTLKQNFLITFFWSRKTHIGQACQGVFIGGRSFLVQVLKINMRLKTFKKNPDVLLYVLPDTQQAVFTNMPNCLWESSFCDSNSEINCKKKVFQKSTIFPRNNSLRTRYAILKTQTKISAETKILPLELGKQVINN